MAGVDWTFLTDLYLNVQYYADALPWGRNSAAQRTFSDGMTFKVSDKFLNSSLETGVQGSLSFSGEGLSTEVYAQYEVDDHWELTTGYIFWDGKETSGLGQFRDNDMIYFKVKYAF